MTTENIFLPKLARILKNEKMTAMEHFLKLQLLDTEIVEEFQYRLGQFIEISVMGVGEAPFSICSMQNRSNILDFCIRSGGRVTSAINRLGEGSFVGVRGPYGNGFPMKEMEGSNLLLVAGGLGVAPLRSVLQYSLKNRAKYGEIAFLYGIRTYDTMLFRDEFRDLLSRGERSGCGFYLSYEDAKDRQCLLLEEEYTDRCMSGVVSRLFERVAVSPRDTYALVCGPSIMYKFVVQELTKRDIPPEKILISLERRMRCGLGKCGNCIIGDGTSIKYVCKDGPVFTYWDALRTKGML